MDDAEPALLLRELRIRGEFLAAASMAMAMLEPKPPNTVKAEAAARSSTIHLPPIRSTPTSDSARSNILSRGRLMKLSARAAEYLSLVNGSATEAAVVLSSSNSLRRRRNQRRRTAKIRFRQNASPGFHESIVPTTMTADVPSVCAAGCSAEPNRLRELLPAFSSGPSLFSHLSGSYGAKLFRLAIPAKLSTRILCRSFCPCCRCFLVRGRTDYIADCVAEGEATSWWLRCRRCAHQNSSASRSATKRNRRSLAKVISRVHLHHAEKRLAAWRRCCLAPRSAKKISLIHRVEKTARRTADAIPSILSNKDAVLPRTEFPSSNSAQHYPALQGLPQHRTDCQKRKRDDPPPLSVRRHRIARFKGGTMTPIVL